MVRDFYGQFIFFSLFENVSLQTRKNSIEEMQCCRSFSFFPLVESYTWPFIRRVSTCKQDKNNSENRFKLARNRVSMRTPRRRIQRFFKYDISFGAVSATTKPRVETVAGPTVSIIISTECRSRKS